MQMAITQRSCAPSPNWRAGLGISIIAEGAETEAELTSLKSIGCDQVQGYSIAFPMPPEQALEWLALTSPKKPQLTVLQGSRA